MRAAILLLTLFALGSAADRATPPASSFGVPDSTDQELRARGARLFETRGCSACHTIGSGTLVGPDLSGVAARRDPAWIAAMIQRPDSMLARDPVAREVAAAHPATMPRLGIAADEARALVAFLSDPPAAPAEAPARGLCPGRHRHRGRGPAHDQGARKESPHPCRTNHPTRVSAFVPTDGTPPGL